MEKQGWGRMEGELGKGQVEEKVGMVRLHHPAEGH